MADYYKTYRIQAHVAVHAYIAEHLSTVYPGGARVLDIAAGTGSLTQRLLDRGFEVHCTTWNDRLEVNAPAYRLDLDSEFALKDVGAIPFDAIVASEIIEHVENPSALLRSCAQCLKPRGILIVSTPNIGYALSRLQTLRRGYPEVFAHAEVVNNRHISMVWPVGFEHIAAAAGLRVLETRYMGGNRRYPLYKRAILHLLISVLGKSANGASCVFLLAHGARVKSDAETTY